MLRASIRKGRLLGLCLAGVVVLAIGAGAWRLSQGPVSADALRPAIERWLASGVGGGRARIGRVSVAWFSSSDSLGLHLDDVTLLDGRGRLVLRASRAEAGLAVASLPGLRPGAGRLSAKDFFAAISVSNQGRYQLGYEASGPPPKGAGNLWRDLEDLAGRPRLGRPLSYLRDVDLEHGTIQLQQIGGPVGWSGQVRTLRLSKLDGRLEAQADVNIGDATLRADAHGAIGLRSAAIRARLANLVPARVFPWAGATQTLSILDAPVQGQAFLSWTAERGVQTADVDLTAGEGRVRLSGAPTPFQSGELRAAYDPRQGAVLIQAARVASAQAQLDIQGRGWMTPESRQSGPTQLKLELSSQHGQLSLSPKIAPTTIDGLDLRAGYAPASGRLAIEDARVKLGGASISLSGVLQRPREPRSWGAALTGQVDGLADVHAVTAVWPDELGREARNWVNEHFQSGKLGKAQLRVSLAPGAMGPGRSLPNDGLRLNFQYEDAALQLWPQAPTISGMRGSGLLQGDRLDMDMQSAETGGVALGQGAIKINRMVGAGRRLEVRTRAQGDASAMLLAVDGFTGGAASAHGFDPRRLTGVGDIALTVARPLDGGAVTYQADYAGAIRRARLAGAAFGMALTSPELKLQGTLEHLQAQAQAQLGPYRGPVRYLADFPSGKATVERAQFDGALDGSSLGMSGPDGSSMRFSAQFENRAEGGRGSVHSPGFSGDVDWSLAGKGRIVLTGVADASALRGIGAPVGAGLPDHVPVRLALERTAGSWGGELIADAYSGTVTFSGGGSRRLRYAAQLTPAEAVRIGLKPGDKPTNLALDVSMTDDAGAANYSLGPWLGQVSWSRTPGAKDQYRWRTTLSPADLHGLGLPVGIEPKAPLPVDVVVTSTAGEWNGSAEIGGGSFRFSALPEVDGRRRLNLGGSVDGAVLANLGLAPSSTVQGPIALSGALDLGAGGVLGGHLEADLQRAAVNAPYLPWKKPTGRAMRIDVDFSHLPDGGWEASSVRGDGPGFGLAGSGQWKASSGGSIKLSEARLEGAFEGSLELGADSEGQKITARARYFDARRLIQEGGKPVAGGGPAAPASGPAKPLMLDVQLGQVRVSEAALVRNVKIDGAWGGDQRRGLELAVTRDDGSGLIALHLTPDANGTAVSGEVSDVGEAAYVVFGQRQFRGGQASLKGRLVQGGADLHVDMSKVRLLQAPALARILTMGSLRGMADTLNGAGIEFAKVSAPVQLRGGRLNIGRARATGPAMGVTTQGVIDIDSQTVDLSGGIAPSYALNSAMGQAPLIGGLFVPHKGEGMFGLTYSAKGAFSSPRISVNPLSLAAPGILRRIFEARSAANTATPPNGG